MSAPNYQTFLSSLGLSPYNPLATYPINQRVLSTDQANPLFNIYESVGNGNFNHQPGVESEYWKWILYVLKVDDPIYRAYVENWCDVNTPNDVIRFTEDGAGVWFIVSDCLEYAPWSFLVDGLLTNGEWVEYTRPDWM